MKKLGSFILTLTLMFFSAAAAQAEDILQFKGKVGFTKNEDKIIGHEFLENGRKILIIGEKNLQIWEVESAKLLNSVPHQIPQFAPRGFISSYILLGLPKILDWRPFIVDEAGRWMITAEKVGDNPLRSAVVRDLQNLKQIAVMDLPNVATEYIVFDKQKDEILTTGTTDKTVAFARWDKEKFTVKELISIKEYKWHQKIRSGQKMMVGSGSTKASLAFDKEGDSLTLRDVKTGAIEKEYSAKNLKPETPFQQTTVSEDERFLISKRDDRVFVWEIDGDGQAKFEISNPNPKGDFDFKQIYEKKLIVVKIDEQLRVYDIEGNGAPLLEVTRQNPKEDLDFIGILNKKYIVVEIDGKIRVYDTQSSGKAPKLEIASDNPKDSMEYCHATKDGRYLALRDDQKLSVYDLAGGEKPIYEMFRRSEKERFSMIKFLDDKNYLVVARVNRSEKKIPKTEFYEIPTGKLVFDADFEAGYQMKFTPDGKYLYQTELGYFALWNIAARNLFWIPLETYTPDSDTNMPSMSSPYNTEYVEFSPDYRYLLRYGDDVTEIFETETGKQLQAIFDPLKVKYDKQNRVKKSGLGNAGWVNNGKYVYAFETFGLFSSINTISFWELKK